MKDLIEALNRAHKLDEAADNREISISQNIEKILRYTQDHIDSFKNSSTNFDWLDDLTYRGVFAIPASCCDDYENVTDEEVEQYITKLLSNKKFVQQLNQYRAHQLDEATTSVRVPAAIREYVDAYCDAINNMKGYNEDLWDRGTGGMFFMYSKPSSAYADRVMRAVGENYSLTKEQVKAVYEYVEFQEPADWYDDPSVKNEFVSLEINKSSEQFSTYKQYLSNLCRELKKKYQIVMFRKNNVGTAQQDSVTAVVECQRGSYVPLLTIKLDSAYGKKLEGQKLTSDVSKDADIISKLMLKHVNTNKAFWISYDEFIKQITSVVNSTRYMRLDETSTGRRVTIEYSDGREKNHNLSLNPDLVVIDPNVDNDVAGATVYFITPEKSSFNIGPYEFSASMWSKNKRESNYESSELNTAVQDIKSFLTSYDTPTAQWGRISQNESIKKLNTVDTEDTMEALNRADELDDISSRKLKESMNGEESWTDYAARRLDEDPEDFLEEMFAKFVEEAYTLVEAEGYTDVFTEPSTQAGRGGDFFWAEKDGVSYRGNYDFEREQEEIGDCCLNADSEEEAIELCAKKYASIILSSLEPEEDDVDESLTEETDSSKGIYVDSGYTDSGEKIGLYRVQDVGRIYKKENNSGTATCIFEGDWQAARAEFKRLSIPRGKLKYIQLRSAGSTDFDWTEETSGLSRAEKQQVLRIVTNNFTLNSGMIRTEWSDTAQALAKTLSKYYQNVEIDDRYRVGYHLESAIFYDTPIQGSLDETMDVMVDPENKSKPFAGDYRALLKMGLQESSASIDVFAEAKNRMPFVTSTSGTNENFEIVFEDDMTGDTFYIRGKLIDNRYNVQVEVHENRRSLWGYRTSVHFWNMNPLAPKSLCTLFDRWDRAYHASGQTSGHMRLSPVFKGWNASLRLSHDS